MAVPLAHVPAVDPAPAPQELLSHWAIVWHAVALVLHVPALDPAPEPQELLSHWAFE